MVIVVTLIYVVMIVMEVMKGDGDGGGGDGGIILIPTSLVPFGLWISVYVVEIQHQTIHRHL